MWPTPRAQDSYERSNWKTIKNANEGNKQGKSVPQMTLTRRVKYLERVGCESEDGHEPVVCDEHGVCVICSNNDHSKCKQNEEL